ncbi:MAG: hypothetical protein HC859_03565 [Bacteroidia bacterium]|nr:hypothetical protein [Bacteroidia bacterium]
MISQHSCKDIAGNNNTAATQALIPLEAEAVYTTNPARNVDSYLASDVLATVTDANGAIVSATVSSGTLPAGVALNATTGAITVSTPSSLIAGSTTFSITTTDNKGGQTTQSVTIVFTADNEAIYTVNAAAIVTAI